MGRKKREEEWVGKMSDMREREGEEQMEEKEMKMKKLVEMEAVEGKLKGLTHWCVKGYLSFL